MERKQLQNNERLIGRISLGIVSVAGLLAIFLFQQTDLSRFLVNEASAITRFMINRSIRFVLNDIFATFLLFALFGNRQMVIIAIFAQLAGIILILIPYLTFKGYYPSYNGPMISFLHRLIMNPVLIYALIFFFWYQERQRSSTDGHHNS